MLRSLKTRDEAQPVRNSFVKLMNTLPTQTTREISFPKTSPRIWSWVVSFGVAPLFLILGLFLVGARYPALLPYNRAISNTQLISANSPAKTSLEQEIADENSGAYIDETLSDDAMSMDVSDNLI